MGAVLFKNMKTPVVAPLATPAFDAGTASADARAITGADLDLGNIEALAGSRALGRARG